MFDDVVKLADLQPGDRLLAVGRATWKANPFLLLQRGFSVVCVGPGATRRLKLKGPRHR
jgi:hypothetical protein